MVDAGKKIKGVRGERGNPSDGQMVSPTVSEYTSGRDTHTIAHSVVSWIKLKLSELLVVYIWHGGSKPLNLDILRN